MVEMNKKEPSFNNNSGNGGNEQKYNNKNQNERFNHNHKSAPNQQKVLVGAIIAVCLIALIYWIVSASSTKKNDALVSEANTTTEQTEKKESFWSSLFKSEPKKPTFDVARTQNGELLISGRVNEKKETKVFILKDEKAFAEEMSDKNGEFVYIHSQRLPEGQAKFSLYVLDEQGNRLYSEQDIIFSISHEPSQDLAVMVQNKESSASKVLQAPAGENIGELYLQNLDYDEDGNMIFSGSAAANSTVNVYINNNLLKSATATSNGTFAIKGETDLDSDETYNIRIDMVQFGKVIKRVSYKFTPNFIDGMGSSYIVKKGDNLWNIAYIKYDNSKSYVVVFEANKNQIKDPNLIYPNQILSVPRKESDFYIDTKKEYEEKEKAE